MSLATLSNVLVVGMKEKVLAFALKERCIVYRVYGKPISNTRTHRPNNLVIERLNDGLAKVTLHNDYSASLAGVPRSKPSAYVAGRSLPS